MFEFYVYERNSEKEDILFGRSFEDACKRIGKSTSDYELFGVEYID